MPSVDDRRVAEIYCARCQSVGTGYLVSPRLVLTARHNVTSEDETRIPADLSCELRLQGDFLEGRTDWRKAEVCWPLGEDWGPQWGLDVALVRIDDDDATRSLAQEPVRWGEPADYETYPCVAMGFPRGRVANRDVREVRTVRSDVEPAEGKRVSRLYMPLNAVDSDQASRRNLAEVDDWGGFSGAAVFADGHLAGVAVDISRSEDMIKAARLNVALRVRGFAALVQHTAASSAASPASLSLGRLVCLLDRQPQEGFIYPQLGTLMSSAPRPLAVCFVPGARHHAHEELAHRLGLKTIPRLLGREFGPAIVRPLNWPRRIENVERSLAILQGQLQSLLNFTAQDIAASQGPPRVLSQAAREAWRRKFDDATAPTILYSELHASMLDEMQAALLLEWLEFLEAIGNLGLERPHVHLFGISWDLLDRASEQQVEDRALAWLKAVEARNLKSVRVLAVPKLESCAWEHVTEWLDGEVLHHRRDLASRRDVLELALREFNNSSEFGLADFKSRVIAISAELHGAP